MIIATGIVVAMVNTPHGLLASAWTTTSASTAMIMIMMRRTLTRASAPTPRPISSLTICPKRFAATPDRTEQHDHVVHAAAQGGANQNPKCSRQEPKLSGEDRANQRAGAGDCRKMMPEHHPAIRRHEIFAVIMRDGGCSALIIQDENLGCEPLAVKTVADRERAEPRGYDPKRADLFATGKPENGQRQQSQNADGDPQQFFPNIHQLNPRRADEILDETKVG